MEEYFKLIQKGVDDLYSLATVARAKGLDPEPVPNIVLAKDMAERVEGLISTVAPQLKDKGVSDRIRVLEKKFGLLDWRVSLVIAEEVAHQKFCSFNDEVEAMEVGIRTGFAYHTLGTVASPLEGFVSLKLNKTREGKDFVSLFYSGPIRSAGGTGASVSVLIADYVRRRMGYADYDPTDDEVKRYATELYDYHERITNLQYLPSIEEIEFFAKNLPVQINGDPSEKREVSNFKDLPRIDTNRIRNGVCLTLGEGLAQKAPKLWKQISKWGHDFGLEHWDFLEEFVSLQKKIKAKSSTDTDETTGNMGKIKPDFTFISDLVAGRPVLTHPLTPGGFRLRYGRARNSGYSATCIHPATMVVLNNYIATGTQLKLERPGKATTVSPSESIEGPIVLLNSGEVLFLSSEGLARKHLSEIKKILFLGDILINYGDFLNRAHILVPPGYCPEWWIQEVEKATVDLFGNLDFDKLSELVNIDSSSLTSLFNNPLTINPSSRAAIKFVNKLKVPLHPFYTYHWNNISRESFLFLIKHFFNVKISFSEKTSPTDAGQIIKLVIPFNPSVKLSLESIGIPHLSVGEEFIVIEKTHAASFAFSLGFSSVDGLRESSLFFSSEKARLMKDNLSLLNSLKGVFLRDKSGCFIGARMGRPEKAKLRKLQGSPHMLFPVGEAGGRLKSFQSALEKGQIRSEFPIFICDSCGKENISSTCFSCGAHTSKKFFCKVCGLMDSEECIKHGKNFDFKIQDIDIKAHFSSALKSLNMRVYPDLIKGVKTSHNKNRVSEPLVKGILRAEHNIFVNKDGTSRFDMSQQPLSHFTPKEVGTPIKKLISMGYVKDFKGKPLFSDDQLLELKPQDIVLPKAKSALEAGAHKVFVNIANFADDLLVRVYGLKPFYNISSSDDLVGHLVAVLAPHTSAGIVCRIVGFSDTQGLYASAVIHAATRRDCDGDEACAILLLDCFLNFSRQYLPAHRGSTQDAPLILTSRLVPSEVDDMVFDMDVAWKYPLDFYNAALEYKDPWDVRIPIFKSRLNTPKENFDFGFTHMVYDMNAGSTCSAYKYLPSMEEKLTGQMDLADKIVAVNAQDVARIVIEKHFIKDIRGNLRKFSTQGFRCVSCNEKFVRPPLIGNCPKCHGKIIFTVSEGNIVKYLGPSISLSEKYNLSSYLRQSLFLTRKMIESIFGEEKDKQVGLGSWFN